jgi:hypothetical protein
MLILLILGTIIYLIIAGIVYQTIEEKGFSGFLISIFWIISWTFKLGEFIAIKWYIYRSLK